jgi:hypothetical protein
LLSFSLKVKATAKVKRGSRGIRATTTTTRRRKRRDTSKS